MAYIQLLNILEQQLGVTGGSACLEGGVFSQDGSRPVASMRAGSPKLPRRGCTVICRADKTVAREFVSDLVELAVYVAYGPGTA